MQNAMMSVMDEAAWPERVTWYRDLVGEMTGYAPQVCQTTRPVLIDGMYWQVPYAVASVPEFVSAGYVYGAVRVEAETEEEALRALCERVHALVWNEAVPVVEMDALSLVGAS